MSTRAERKAKRAARRDAANVLMPPEGVPIRLPVAGIGVRLSAQIADVLVTGIAAICIVVLLFAVGLTDPVTMMAVSALAFFVIRIPYYVLTELVWNGQTLGKKWMKIRVVAHDGRSLQTHAIVLRNFMKEAEIFLPGTLLLTLDAANPVYSVFALLWIVMAFVIPARDSHRRRLGDIMAGTHVVHLPALVLLRDMAQAARARLPGEKPKFTFLPHQLDHYGAFELQTLETFLRRATDGQEGPAARERAARTARTIVEKVRAKIGYADKVEDREAEAFLQAFYTAQRTHLEQRQLFGDRRADKHHAKSDSS